MREQFFDEDLSKGAGGKNSSQEIECAVLHELIETKPVKQIFDICNVPLDDVGDIINLLDRDGVGLVNMDEFLGACTRLRGEAKSRDVYTLKLATDCMWFKFRYLTLNRLLID